jgi:hypothetical protein
MGPAQRKDRRMVHVDLSEEECAVLRELLALRSQTIQHEIHHTDSREFRARLRHQEDVLRDLSERLRVEEPAAVR